MVTDDVALELCLPPDLRGPQTTISRVSAGLSGARVYRVDAGGRAFALKIAGRDQPLALWRRKLQIQQLAADARVAPAVVHVDEDRRAILSGFVADQSFFPLYGNPATRAVATDRLAAMLRTLHQLPVPAGDPTRGPEHFIADAWSLLKTVPVPPFVAEAVRQATVEPSFEPGPPVLCHNDVNPSNVVYDGERLMLLDWETAGPNDAFYDLGAISIFLRMDADACRTLLTAYEGAAVAAIPERFTYNRRLAAILCATQFLLLAHLKGHAGATGEETVDTTLTLGEMYQRMRTGALDIASAEGQWQFGLALAKAGLSA
jgi:aminoglycoside phosphotransferase (APT) family kinase protein